MGSQVSSYSLIQISAQEKKNHVYEDKNGKSTFLDYIFGGCEISL